MWVWSLGGKDPLEKEMATHSSSLAWRIPGTGEPSGLLSMGLHRVGHDWSDLAAAASSNSFRAHVGNLWSGSSLKLTGILGCCEKTYTCGTRKIWQESPWILGRSSHGRLSPTSARVSPTIAFQGHRLTLDRFSDKGAKIKSVQNCSRPSGPSPCPSHSPSSFWLPSFELVSLNMPPFTT